MDTVEQASQMFSELLGSKPFWSREVSGEVSYRVERFVCRGWNLTAPPLAQPVLISQFGGKKVSSQLTSEQVTSFPSVSTLIPAGIETTWAIQSSLDFAVLYFRDEALQQLQRSIVQHVEPVALTSPLCCSLTKELAGLMPLVDKTDENTGVDERHIQALSGALVWQLCYELTKPAKQQAVQSMGSQFNYVQEALRYIHANLDQPLRVENVAAQVGLHPSHFRKVFRQVSGNTLHRYVLEQRLEQARELLTTSSLTLSDISERTGFSSQSHMATSFRKYYDVTPATFRRMQGA